MRYTILFILKGSNPMVKLLILSSSILITFQASSQKKENFSAFHPIDLNERRTFQDMHFLDTIVGDYNFFLCGEYHSVSSSSLTYLKLFKYFSKQADVRYLILELGNSFAFLLNKFLETGDVSSLIREDHDSFVWLYDRPLLEELREFNQRLHKGDKIKFFGIDSEDPEDFFRALLLMFENTKGELSLADSIKNILTKIPLDSFSRKDMHSYQKMFRKDLEQRKLAYKNYLGEDFFDFELMIKNKVKLTYSLSRDYDMYRNLLRIFKKFSDKSFFASFGLDHTNPNVRKRNLVNFLRRDERSPVRESLCLINPQYEQCKLFHSFDGLDAEPFDFGLLSTKNKNFNEYKQLFSELAIGDVNMIDIRSLINPSKTLINSCDYLIFLKNQEAFQFSQDISDSN